MADLFLSFHDNNGRHYVRRDDVLYAFAMDQPDPNGSLMTDRSWYLTLEYKSGRSLTFVFHREAARDKIRNELIPDEEVRRV